MELFGQKDGKLRKIIDCFLDYIFPKNCFRCQKEGEYLCSACFDKIPLIDNQCFLCQSDTTSSGICPDCQLKTGIDQIIVATKYNNNVTGQLVEALKYSYVEEVSEILVDLLIRQLNDRNVVFSNKEAVIFPIPLHAKREKERGFNQASLIAQQLATELGLSLDEKVLIRRRQTRQQAKLTRQERWINMKESFVVNNSVILEEVVIVDDVLTTGATMIAAAQKLKEKGVKRITCLAICHG